MPGQEGKGFEGLTLIIMMFRCEARNKDRPVWSQAFSSDNGKTWEWNWYNVSERIP